MKASLIYKIDQTCRLNTMTAQALNMSYIYFIVNFYLVVISCLEYFDISQNSIQGKRLIQSSFRKIDRIGPRQCLKECFRRKRECQSINYMKKQLLCELNLADTAQGNVVFENDGDYVFISISGVQSHHKISKGCWTRTCEKNEICSILKTELNMCIEERFKDCKDLRKQGAVYDGTFTITPQPSVSKPVLCDMTTEGGGWVTVFHRVHPFELSFNRSWSDFKEGFADATVGEQWLGSEFLHLLTKDRMSDVYFKLQATNGSWFWATYDGFYVAGESTRYTVYYNSSSYTGTAGEGLTVIVGPTGNGNINGRQFGTFDMDISNCASVYGGGWWYRGEIGCAYSMLTIKEPYWNGHGQTLVGYLHSITMMVRPYP